MNLCLGFIHMMWKPKPFGNNNHLIADKDGGHPILWKILKLFEWKDHPKLRNGMFTVYVPIEVGEEWFEKTPVNRMLYMLSPCTLHHTGKIVNMDSSFCVAMDIIMMHKQDCTDQKASTLAQTCSLWLHQQGGDEGWRGVGGASFTQFTDCQLSAVCGSLPQEHG